MHFYCLNSTKFIVWFKKHIFAKTTSFSKAEFLSDARSSTFIFPLLLHYLKFVIYKFHGQRDINHTPRIFRSKYCIDTIFKHVLIIEWGSINLKTHPADSSLELTANDDFKWYRSESLFEYPVTFYDLFYPFHKSSIYRYVFFDEMKALSPNTGFNFFFNFYLILPFEINGYYSNYDFYDLLGSLPPPPIAVNYPIVFELILLKFNIFAFIFSESKLNIYSYYNGTFFNSILVRLKSIFYILYFRIIDRLFFRKEFYPTQVTVFNFVYDFLNIKMFYSTGSFNFDSFHTFFSLIEKKNLINFTFLMHKLQWFFSFLSFTFFVFFLLLSSFFSVNLDVGFAELSLMRLYFIIYCFIIFLFFSFFLRFLLHLCFFRFKKHKWSKNLKLTLIYFRLHYYLSLMFLNFFEAWVFIIVLFFIFYFFNFTFSISILLYSSVLLFFIFLDKFVFIFNTIFLPLSHNSVYSNIFFLYTPVAFILQILFILFFFISLPLFNLLFSFFNYLSSHVTKIDKYDLMPNLISSRLPSLPNFKVPLATFFGAGDLTDLDFKLKSTLLQLTSTRHYGLIANELKPSLEKWADDVSYLKEYYALGYFSKFLINKKNELVEIQYNYLNYEYFLMGRRSYASRTSVIFPNKFVFFLMLINIFPFYCFLNFKELFKLKNINNSLKFSYNSLFFGTDLKLTTYNYLIKY